MLLWILCPPLILHHLHLNKLQFTVPANIHYTVMQWILCPPLLLHYLNLTVYKCPDCFRFIYFFVSPEST